MKSVRYTLIIPALVVSLVLLLAHPMTAEALSCTGTSRPISSPTSTEDASPQSLADFGNDLNSSAALLMSVSPIDHWMWFVLQPSGWRFSGPALRLLPRAILAILAIGGALWWITLGRMRQRARMNALDDEDSTGHGKGRR